MGSQYKHLLQPGKIGKLTLKNRVIFNPCETLYATVGGEVTQKLIDFYVQRAAGGAGLLVVRTTRFPIPSASTTTPTSPCSEN